MSRSYRKYPPWKDGEWGSSYWGSVRQNERSCLSNILRGNPDDDVPFPVYRKNGARRGCYYPVSEIRTEYFTEIRNILNGYHEVHRHGYTSDAEEHFLHCYNRIKGTEPGDGAEKGFDWLNTAEAKAAVKAWKGAPLAILPLLARGKIIEKAVAAEVKRRGRK